MTIWRRWLVANVVGVTVGFGLAGVLMIVAGDLIAPATDGPRVLLAVIGTLVLGCVEGTTVGFAQWTALEEHIPSLDAGAWLQATIVGAIFAWGCGMAIGAAAGETFEATSAGSPVAVGIVIGAVAGTILTTPQWLALRHAGVRPTWWIPLHALAWAVGMVVAFAGLSILPPSADFAMLAVTMVLTGLAMGAAVAAITGIAGIATLRPTPSRSPARQ